jgi:excisionase family DNA binding protein
MTDPTTVIVDITDEELLDRYISLSEKERVEEFLTTEHAAEIAGMSQRTIQLWVDVGDLRAIFLGRKCRVHRDSLMAYLKYCNNDH